MAEPEKDQIGDGQDNFGQAAGKAIQAAKQISHDAAAEAAVKGAEATANAAAAVVQAGAESGKAVAEIAVGTAAGGPLGAILSAAWAMRHSLFKVLVCICLFLLIIVILHPEYRSGQCVWPERGSSRRRSHAGIVLLRNVQCGIGSDRRRV